MGKINVKECLKNIFLHMCIKILLSGWLFIFIIKIFNVINPEVYIFTILFIILILSIITELNDIEYRFKEKSIEIKKEKQKLQRKYKLERQKLINEYNHKLITKSPNYKICIKEILNEYDYNIDL